MENGSERVVGSAPKVQFGLVLTIFWSNLNLNPRFGSRISQTRTKTDQNRSRFSISAQTGFETV